MRLEDLQTGTKLELELYDDSGEKEQVRVVSQLEGCEDEHTAIIAAPIYGGEIYSIHNGIEMDIYFLQNEQLFRFKAKVMSKEKIGNILALKIKRLTNIQKIQRRDFFRFDNIIPVIYRVIDSVDDIENNTIQYKKSITKDLSGSGLCMLVEERLDEYAQLECGISLAPDYNIYFIGRIIRVIKCDFESKYKYEIGLSYKLIENKDREEIVKYIFNEQRKLRKKGLI